MYCDERRWTTLPRVIEVLDSRLNCSKERSATSLTLEFVFGGVLVVSFTSFGLVDFKCGILVFGCRRRGVTGSRSPRAYNMGVDQSPVQLVVMLKIQNAVWESIRTIPITGRLRPLTAGYRQPWQRLAAGRIMVMIGA